MKWIREAVSITRPPVRRADFGRREFIALSCTALVGATGFQHGSDQRVVVGAHPWVYAATQPEYKITPILDQIFSDMSYAGMEGIELMHTALRPAESVARIKELSRRHSLPIIGASFGGQMWDRQAHDEVLKDAELVIPRLAEVGGTTLGTSVGRAPKQKSETQLDAQAELLEKIVGICESHGVVLNLHNHTYEVENDLYDLRGTLSRLPHLALGPDLNWLIRGGVEPVDFIREFGNQIIFLHLRDQNGDGTWSEAMGEGATDFGSIAEEVRKIGFSGHAVIELAHEKDFEPTRPLRDSLKMSRAFVATVFGY